LAIHTAEVSVTLEATPGAAVAFSDILEVSLDCCVCRRCIRTVALSTGGVEGVCAKTRHPFPGRITSKDTREASVTYRIEYDYEPFVDAKYPVRRPQPWPQWARVSFTITCPQCGAGHDLSVQNNSSRPWTHFCECGHALYTERVEMPRLHPRIKQANSG
jgi:hypothetical protein